MKPSPNPKIEGRGQNSAQSMNESNHSVSSGNTMMTVDLPQNDSQGFLWGSFSGSVRYGGSSSDRIGCGLKIVNSKDMNINNNDNNNNDNCNGNNSSDVSSSVATSALPSTRSDPRSKATRSGTCLCTYTLKMS